MFLHSLWTWSTTKIQKGVGDHLQSKNERNIKICFFKYEVLVGGEQNCLQWLTLRKADYKSSSNSKENFIAQGDIPVQVFPSPLYPLKQRHTYDPSVLVHRALESQSCKSSVAHSSTSTQNRGIKKQSLSHNCQKFKWQVYKGTMVLNRWGRGGGGDGVDNDYWTLQKGWALFQALAFVRKKQVIPGCAWLIGGERRCWHHKKTGTVN